MTSEIQFVVPGQPVAKGRPKFARRGKYVTTYSPAKTVNYDGLVAHAAAFAMVGKDLIKGAVSVDLDIRLQIPESWSKKKQKMAVDGLIAATKRSDIDNITKGIFDGMNGVVWRDDGQVVEATQRKRYAETPGVVVIVRELDLKMPNKILTNEEFDEDITKAYASTESQHILVSDKSFERMKKYLTQEKIEKAEYLREIIRSNPEYFLQKYA